MQRGLVGAHSREARCAAVATKHGQEEVVCAYMRMLAQHKVGVRNRDTLISNGGGSFLAAQARRRECEKQGTVECTYLEVDESRGVSAEV